MKYDKIEYQLVEVKRMTVKINTKDGQVELTDDVIATVVGGAATEIFGVVGMASKNALKDNFQALLGKENYSKGVVVKAAEDGSIAVDVYTVLSYGTKISRRPIVRTSPRFAHIHIFRICFKDNHIFRNIVFYN